MRFTHRLVSSSLGALASACAAVGGAVGHDDRECAGDDGSGRPRREDRCRRAMARNDDSDLVYHGGEC